jgi:hypothetical protein
MKALLIALIVAMAVALVLQGVNADAAYQAGYDKAKAELGATAEQCHKWWFGDNKANRLHAMRQFCNTSCK